MGLTLAEKVRVETSTSSPGPTPASSSARCSAAVPELSASGMGRADRRGELSLERVHLRAQRRDPVGRERFLDELLLQAGHMGRGEIDALFGQRGIL